MSQKSLLFLVFGLTLATGCRFFKSEASIQIQALTGDGEALVGANVLVNKVLVGHTDAHGAFKGVRELPVDEPIIVEVNKASTETFYAPFFETIRVKRDDMNSFKLTATLYGIKQDTAPAAPVAAPLVAQPPTPADPHATVSPEKMEVLAVSADLDPPTFATATDVTATASAAVETDNGRAVTFYVVSGRDAIENASVYFGDPGKKQWVHGCYSNSNGRCSFKVPQRLATLVTLVRANGFQTQSRSFQLLDNDKVRFELNRGKALEVFAISPNQGNMEGVDHIKVSLNGKFLGHTDRFGSFITPLSGPGEEASKLTLEASDWLPTKAEFTLNQQAGDSIIQHFQSLKPKAPKVAVMDFILYRDRADGAMLNPPSLEALQSALKLAGASIVNGPNLNGKLAEQKISLNELSGGNWAQLKKIDEPLHYIIRPSFVEGAAARIILSAIEPRGRMIYSASQSVKAKGSTQAVLNSLAARMVQHFGQEGAVVEQQGEDFYINLGKAHAVQIGSKVEITGNVRLPTGEISAWDTIATGIVSEVGAERSRIKLNQTQPDSRVEPGNSVRLVERNSSPSEPLTLAVQEDQTQGPIGLAEIFADDQWLGASDLSGQAQIAEVDMLKVKEMSVFSPGFVPKKVSFTAGTRAMQLALTHESTPVQIESQPSGAIVKINGRDLGRTPIDTEIPYPGAAVNIEIGGVDGFEFKTRTQTLGNRGIILKGETQITLNRDPQQAARTLVSEGKVTEAIQILEGILEPDSNFLLAHHQLGELYLNQLHDPLKAATAFHKVTSNPLVDGFRDKRFIGTFINEAVALFQAGEQVLASDSNRAVSYWRQTEAILTRTEDQLRFVPQAQYNQAVHTLSYYRALSLHKTWLATQNLEDQEHAAQRWKDYIQGTALALPQDQHYEWVKKAEAYFQAIQTARNKPRGDTHTPVAM